MRRSRPSRPRPSSSGIETVWLPAAAMLTVTERTMPPIMSGAHGGVVPSAALHAESP